MRSCCTGEAASQSTRSGECRVASGVVPRAPSQGVVVLSFRFNASPDDDDGGDDYYYYALLLLCPFFC